MSSIYIISKKEKRKIK